jgi:hypothetical protein
MKVAPSWIPVRASRYRICLAKFAVRGPLSRVHLRVPQKEGKLLALLEARSRIFSRAYKDGLVEMEAEAPESVVRKVKGFVVVKED